MGMAKVIREAGTLWINPNAGAGAVTGALCAPNIFRTSFSNWQTTYALGKVLKAKGHKNAVFITWKYAAGEEMMQGFKEGFEKEGGKLIKELYTPFPQVEFQALLTEIARERGIRRFEAEVLAGNAPMLRVFQHSGLPMSRQVEDGVVHVVMDL